MQAKFPTFVRLIHGVQRLSPVLTTPWWPADRLASKQRALLRILRVAATERMEAAPLVENLAAEHRFRFRRRLRLLARRLAAGTPLADALEQTPGVVSDQQQLAIRFGEQAGTLPAILTNLLERDDTTTKQTDMRLRQIAFYATITTAIFVFVLSFILIKIIPSYQAIFDDFDLELPRPTILMIGVSTWAVNYWYLLALPVALMVWLIFSERSRRFFRRKLWSRILPPVAQLRSADLLSLLSISVRAGRPLAGAISTLARYHFDTLVRHKLLFVRNEIEQGTDVWDSMATARLLSPQESCALDNSTSSESRAWSMTQLAQLRQGRVAGRIEIVVTFLQALVILLLAGAVLLVAIACLSPLIDMVSGLSG
ncbi:type II secretion system F family protein [Bythopirellula polymerisocia]|uniref:Type II secretion system protein F n=1 Tax=Bythopirellula polymerisocia TaxID=2528003 RepID=A0A5C6CYI8_9BACT|nr:type II secretion system F family protein [Bythopirellula polymerisocia]TWU28056.1 Type II secretion system protein F [Bythopirellula polymerisocia]